MLQEEDGLSDRINDRVVFVFNGKEFVSFPIISLARLAVYRNEVGELAVAGDLEYPNRDFPGNEELPDREILTLIGRLIKQNSLKIKGVGYERPNN